MRICLVSREYPPDLPGGIATQTALKARGLAARGHEVHVITSSGGPAAHHGTDAGALVHRIPEPTVAVNGYETATFALKWSFDVAEKLHALDREVGFDVVQFPEYLGEGLVYQTDTWDYRTARFVVQMHGPLSMFARHMGWPDLGSTLHETAAYMEQAVLRRADLLLASSRTTADFCAAEYGVPRDQVEVIHSGVDTAAFRPLARPAGDGCPRILFVGNIAGNKGVHRVVRAARKLSEIHAGTVLRIAGRGDLNALGVDRDDPRFEVLGYVPHAELPEHYAWCDIFAGPSSYEPGPGNVYLEAMAAGRPIVAGATGGAPEVVTDGITGLLIDPHDEHALVGALDRLTLDPGLRASLATAGRAQAERDFALPVYLDKVESAYERVLALAAAETTR